MPTELIQNIAVIADGTEMINHRREFTDTEIITFSRENINKLMEKRMLKTEIKELQKQIREIDKEADEFVDKVEKGAVEKTVKAFYINDHVTNFRKYYDEEGNFLSERKLRPEERQMTLRQAIGDTD